MAKIEVFTANCPLCEPAIATVRATVCPNCEVTVYDLSKGEGLDEAKVYGVLRVPSVVVNGKVAGCCSQGTVDAEELKRMGVGS